MVALERVFAAALVCLSGCFVFCWNTWGSILLLELAGSAGVIFEGFVHGGLEPLRMLCLDDEAVVYGQDRDAFLGKL